MFFYQSYHHFLRSSHSRVFLHHQHHVGDVFTWGRGALGQLGLGDDIVWQDEPRLIASPLAAFDRPHQLDAAPLARSPHLDPTATERFVQATSGAHHTLFLTNLGRVFCSGALHGTFQVRAPSLVPHTSNLRTRHIASGYAHALLAAHAPPDHDDPSLAPPRLLFWHRHGPAAPESLVLRHPVLSMAAGEDWSLLHHPQGRLTFIAHRLHPPYRHPRRPAAELLALFHEDAQAHRVLVEELTVETQGHHTLLHLHTRSVWRQLAAGWGHCHLLDAEGRLFSLGSNVHGQCGPGRALYPLGRAFPALRCKAVATGAAHTLVISHDDRLLFFGSIGDAKLDAALIPPGHGRPDAAILPVPVPVPEAPLAIAAGDNHSLVLTKSHLYAWGFGQHAALGSPPHRTNASRPKIVALDFPQAHPPAWIFTGMDLSGCIF